LVKIENEEKSNSIYLGGDEPNSDNEGGSAMDPDIDIVLYSIENRRGSLFYKIIFL